MRNKWEWLFCTQKMAQNCRFPLQLSWGYCWHLEYFFFLVQSVHFGNISGNSFKKWESELRAALGSDRAVRFVTPLSAESLKWAIVSFLYNIKHFKFSKKFLFKNKVKKKFRNAILQGQGYKMRELWLDNGEDKGHRTCLGPSLHPTCHDYPIRQPLFPQSSQPLSNPSLSMFNEKRAFCQIIFITCACFPISLSP